MTTPQGFLFLVASTFTLLGGLGTVLAEKPLRAAMSLLLTVLSIAGLYLSLHAELLASLQMLVYAGAVVVLFVFVIMLIGPEGGAVPPQRKVMVPLLSSLLVGTFTLMLLGHVVRVTPSVPPTAPEGFGTVEGLGLTIYRDAVVPFEAISITLLVAILAAIAVARGRTQDEAAALRKDRRARKEEAA